MEKVQNIKQSQHLHTSHSQVQICARCQWEFRTGSFG